MDLLRGFIFDIDGTLLDSNDAHARSLHRALDQSGFHFSYEHIRKLIGMGLDQIIPSLSIETDAAQKIKDLKNEYFEIEFLSLNPFSQATELLSALYVRGYQLTVASSASPEDLRRSIQKLQIGPYLIAAASSGDAPSKPDPDLIHKALQQLNLPPDEVFMVGDTPYDITAAKRAGVRTIALRCGGWNDHDLREAVAIFDDPSDFLSKIQTQWKPSEVFNPA